MNSVNRVVIARNDLNTKTSRLNLKDGDCLLIKAEKYIPETRLRDIIMSLRNWLDAHCLSNVLILFVDDECDLQDLNEVEMKKHGWIKDKKPDRQKGDK